jgi:hypothetical protein
MQPIKDGLSTTRSLTHTLLPEVSFLSVWIANIESPVSLGEPRNVWPYLQYVISFVASVVEPSASGGKPAR